MTTPADMARQFNELADEYDSLTRAFKNLSAVLREDRPTPLRLRWRVRKLEAEFDAIYHGPPLRSDFDNGVCRGLALALAAVRRTTVEIEVQRSLLRLEAIEAKNRP